MRTDPNKIKKMGKEQLVDLDNKLREDNRKLVGKMDIIISRLQDIGLDRDLISIQLRKPKNSN